MRTELVTTLKRQATKVLERIRMEKEPLLITEHGKPAAYLVDAPLIRISVNPSRENGLKKESQLMVDKIQAVSRARVGERVGKMDPKTMKRINQSLAFVLGLGE